MITFHALILIAVLLSPIVLLFVPVRRPKPYSPTLREVLLRCIPFLIVGTICLLLLSAQGVPVPEWLIPWIAALMASLVARSERAYLLFTRAMFLTAVFLCVQGLWVLSLGYTSRPEMYAGMNAAIWQANLTAIRSHLAADPSLTSQVKTPVPLRSLLPGDRAATVKVTNLHRRWYTPITRMYEIEVRHKEVWYLGTSDGKPQLELRG